MPQFATNTQLPRYLRVEQERIEKIARGLGLDFFPTVFEMLSYDQMNEVAAYGGFPNRYPHWRFGMEYERLSKSYEYGLSKIYEMVINNNPSFAYLLEGNSLTDQKLVMCHVFGHVDFFKNNFAFRATDLDAVDPVTDPVRQRGDGYDPNRKWVDKMANHGAGIRRIVDRYGIHKVEEFVDVCLSLENLIDPWSRFVVRRRPEVGEEDHPTEIVVPRLRAKEYLDDFINPQEYIDEQKKKLEDERDKKKGRFPAGREQDILQFLIENAPLERWERAILSITRDEGYYFVPQMQTKIMNEGWACVAADTLVFTERGLIPMQRLVAGDAQRVADGDGVECVYDQNVILNHATVTIRTRRGLELTGSNNHRLLLADGVSWKRLDELEVGAKLRVAGGNDLWPSEEVRTNWTPATRVSLEDVADQAGVSLWTVLRHRAGRPVRQATAVAEALECYDAAQNQSLPQALRKRQPVRIPETVTAELGAFLGYLVGDGHVSRKKREIGLTTGDESQALEFVRLAQELFGLVARMRWDEGRLRVILHSESLSDFLIEGLGLTFGPSAREKRIPEAVLRSPEAVVRSFLRAYFDCDGHGGKQGVILSTSSLSLARQTQLLLLNFGILSRRRAHKDGCYHLHVSGASAARFADRVGFGLERKQAALTSYVTNRRWLKTERWEDEVVSVESGRADVYDISVENTHRYAAAGLINHNSYWHSKMMTGGHVCDFSEIIDYADNNAGVMATSGGRLNPYKLGVELFRSVEERWNKGQFGPEWQECDDLDEKRHWDLRLGLGRDKIFEVRALYNDVTFIDEFLTEDFAIEHKLFTYAWSNRNERFEIESREFRNIKEKLLSQLTNFGSPFIYVEDANWENRGELLLTHEHRGVDLRSDYARETMASMVRVWKRPVCLGTIIDGKKALLRYDGKEHSVRHDAP